MQAVCSRSCLLGGAIAAALLAGCGASPEAQSQAKPTPNRVAAPVPVASPPGPAPLPAIDSASAKLLAKVRQGNGYVILFRHALAPGTGDPPQFRLGDCSTQRNLSAEGRQQAIRIGEILRQTSIPVVRVLSSQWCRCLETAQLMNLGPVAPNPILNSFFQDRRTEGRQTAQLRQLIQAHRDQPGVVVMVTHQVNITAISQQVPAPGAAIVLRATTPDQIEVIGSVHQP